MAKASAEVIRRMKAEGRKIVMLTAYDYPTAQFVEEAGVDMLLVGDTLGVVVLGFESTREVTMDMMLTHVAAARRGAPNTHVVGDMPFRSYDTPELALANAKRFMDAGADSAKLEGAAVDAVEAIRATGIDVVGHVGLLPQTATRYKPRGRTDEEATAIRRDARALEAAGCFAIVLEHMPLVLGRLITEELAIPTIGIGAGPHCDGQVLVLHDMLGIFDEKARFRPPFVKRFAEVGLAAKEGCRKYVEEVRAGAFPDLAHSTR